MRCLPSAWQIFQAKSKARSILPNEKLNRNQKWFLKGRKFFRAMEFAPVVTANKENADHGFPRPASFIQ